MDIGSIVTFPPYWFKFHLGRIEINNVKLRLYLDAAAAPLLPAAAAAVGRLPILATRPTTVVMTARVSAAPSSATVSSDHASPPLPEWDEEDCRRSSSVCDEPSTTAKCCEDS